MNDFIVVVVRSTYPALRGAGTATSQKIYEGPISGYQEGVGVFDEGDTHVHRNMYANLLDVLVRLRINDAEIMIPPAGVVVRPEDYAHLDLIVSPDSDLAKTSGVIVASFEGDDPVVSLN